MLESRVTVVQENLRRYLDDVAPRTPRRDPDLPLRDGSSLSCRAAIALFQDQVLSRLLDVMSRELKDRNESFYTIASAGHEQNAVLGAQLRLTDPCFLHYRSGGLMMARSRKDSGVDPVLDTLLSFAASSEDPISGGRHKVWGSLRMQVPPQTSTIASHLPKAMGLAFAIGRRKKLGLEQRLPEDSIVLCSFGDASASHAVAMAGINGARYAFRRGNPMPILFLCEDNRVGISVSKPRRWIADSYSGLSQLEYFAVQSGDLVEIWDTVEKAINVCRSRRKPVFLRVPTVRLWGHAGSDVETTYRSIEEIERMEAQDPLLANAKLLVETGAASPRELLSILDSTRRRVEQTAAHVVTRPKLTTAEAVMAPLAPMDLGAARESVIEPVNPQRRAEIFRGPAARGSHRTVEAQHGRPDQCRTARRNDPPAGGHCLRRGCREERRRLLRHDRIAGEVRGDARLRHPARRDHDPRDGPGPRPPRAAPDPRDPVPRLPAQRDRPAAKRGLLPPVLQQRPVPQPDGRPHRRLRVPDAASADTSTTTTRSGRCARFPACCWRPPRAVTTRYACSGACSRWPR